MYASGRATKNEHNKKHKQDLMHSRVAQGRENIFVVLPWLNGQYQRNSGQPRRVLPRIDYDVITMTAGVVIRGVLTKKKVPFK